jgi:hypothetical protein
MVEKSLNVGRSTMATFLRYFAVVPVLLVSVVSLGGCRKDGSMRASKPAPKENGGDGPTGFEPVRPAFEMKIDSPDQDPTVKNVRKPDPRGDRIRNRSRAILQAGGFHFTGGLPTAGHRAGVAGKLRPIREVAVRLMALDALFAWVNSPESSVPTARLNAYMNRNDLRAHMTEEEREILALSRADAHELHNDTIAGSRELNQVEGAATTVLPVGHAKGAHGGEPQSVKCRCG